MAGAIWHYEELTSTQLAGLDRVRTLALMALGPLEVHGPHLPLGTDLLVAQELQRRVVGLVGQRWSETDFLLLPPAFLGADTVPDPTSVDVDSRAVYRLLMAIGRSLSSQGFRTLVVTDNHGGPRHQIAIEKAVRRLYRRHGLVLIAPSNRFCRRMIEQDSRILAKMGLSPGLGDASDAHAGTAETSMVLIFAPGLVLPLWRRLPRKAVPQEASKNRLLRAVAGMARGLGARRLARDLAHLSLTLGWLGMEPMPTYLGAPAQANAEDGDRMLDAHAAVAISMLEEARAGHAPFSEPLLWDLRFIERS